MIRDRFLTQADKDAAVALVLPVTGLMEHLDPEARIGLLCALLVQELCMLPPSEREAELEGIIDDLPAILQASVRGMRQALAENARDA